jgi:hypothetical protein
VAHPSDQAVSAQQQNGAIDRNYKYFYFKTIDPTAFGKNRRGRRNTTILICIFILLVCVLSVVFIQNVHDLGYGLGELIFGEVIAIDYFYGGPIVFVLLVFFLIFMVRIVCYYLLGYLLLRL